MTSEEYTTLMKSIQREGISNPGILEIVNRKGGDYEVILGEGNHRLKAAVALQINSFPLTFSYGF